MVASKAVKMVVMFAVIIAVSAVSLVQFPSTGDAGQIFDIGRTAAKAGALLFAPIMLYVIFKTLTEIT